MEELFEKANRLQEEVDHLTDKNEKEKKIEELIQVKTLIINALKEESARLSKLEK